MRGIWFIVLLFSAICGSPSWAQPAPFRDPLVDRLAGKWILRGTIEGREVVHDVTGQWVLGHQYMMLRETSRELKPGSTVPAYEAHIYIGWDQAQRRYGVVWLDVFGETSTPALGTATPMINALPFVFTGRDGTVTRTTFTHNRGTGRWRWQIVTEKNGQATPFADLEMIRAPAQPGGAAGTGAGRVQPAATRADGLPAALPPSRAN